MRRLALTFLVALAACQSDDRPDDEAVTAVDVARVEHVTTTEVPDDLLIEVTNEGVRVVEAGVLRDARGSVRRMAIENVMGPEWLTGDEVVEPESLWDRFRVWREERALRDDLEDELRARTPVLVPWSAWDRSERGMTIVELRDELIEAVNRKARWAVQTRSEYAPTALVAIAPDVSYERYSAVLWTAGETELMRFGFVVRTPKGYGLIETGPRCPPAPCTVAAVVVGEDGVVPLTAGAYGEQCSRIMTITESDEEQRDPGLADGVLPHFEPYERETSPGARGLECPVSLDALDGAIGDLADLVDGPMCPSVHLIHASGAKLTMADVFAVADRVLAIDGVEHVVPVMLSGEDTVEELCSKREPSSEGP